MNFSETLKALRVQKGLTQRELAKLLNLSNGSIAMYETGKREPDFNTLGIIANFFEVSTDYLLGNVSRPVEIIAAYRPGDTMEDLPPEALAELETLKQYILSKYKKEK